MAKDLTDLAVKKEVPGAVRREVPDGKVRGLYLVIQPSGRRSWAYRYRNTNGSTRKLTLGAYPGTTLEAARRAAGKALTAIAEGIDPAAEKSAARKAVRENADHHLCENVVANFIERHAKLKTRETTWRESERILDREILSRWRGKPLSVIRKSDIHQLLDAIVDRGAPAGALRSLQAIRPMFKWAVERGIIPLSPCDGVSSPTQPRQRDRFLSDVELAAVWRAAEGMGYPFGYIVQLLILLGQRRDEIAGAVAGEIDIQEKLWTLPPSRSKNKNAHAVPLPSPAVAIIKELPVIESSAGFLFTTTGTTHVSGFGKTKERLDKAIAADRLTQAEAVGTDPASLPEFRPWTFHDLRRTFATGCARLGVAPQVVEAILNHRSGTIRGVAAIYNRYDHAAEKRAALDLWAKHVEQVVSAGAQS